MLDENKRAIFKVYKTLATPDTFEKWLDMKLPVFEMRSANDLIAAGETQKIVDVLEKLAKKSTM